MFIICQETLTIIYVFAANRYKRLNSGTMDKFCCRKLAAYISCVWLKNAVCGTKP